MSRPRAMKRGDVIVVAATGDCGKPRPALIVQTDAFPDPHTSVVVCQMTPEIVEAPDFSRYDRPERAKSFASSLPNHGRQACDSPTGTDRTVDRSPRRRRYAAPQCCAGLRNGSRRLTFPYRAVANRRSVREFQRPSRRSFMSDSTADALARGGGVLKSAVGGPVRRGRATPSRMSRDNLPSCPPSSPTATGSSRATGRPRSTINAGEPPLRPSIKALKLFWVSVMPAFFIELKWP